MARTKIAPILVQKFLKGINYPVNKRELIEHARKNMAGEDIISMLEGLKKDSFATPAEVSKSFGDED